MAQYIYTMNRVAKIVPPRRFILRDISLSFFPGAKIGVLGLNGSGKSSLLRIMAGLDKEFDGEARPQPGINIGYLPQEPELDESKNVRETNEIYVPPGPRLGDVVLEVKNLKKGYGYKLLIDDLSFLMPPGSIAGIIGPNGAGKTTLFRMITGQVQPDSGSIRVGDSVVLASVDQSRDSLDDDKSIWEEISCGLDQMRVGNYETPSRAYFGRFNFRGAEQQKKIGLLSGGERNRVHLAKMLRAGGNLLLLDEPTNDLDVATLRALEQAVLAFPGSVVVISHDRWFLDRIATHILAPEGNSQVVWFTGNYSEYELDRRQRLGSDAEQPHRIKYTRLSA